MLEKLAGVMRIVGERHMNAERRFSLSRASRTEARALAWRLHHGRWLGRLLLLSTMLGSVSLILAGVLPGRALAQQGDAPTRQVNDIDTRNLDEADNVSGNRRQTQVVQRQCPGHHKHTYGQGGDQCSGKSAFW